MPKSGWERKQLRKDPHYRRLQPEFAELMAEVCMQGVRDAYSKPRAYWEVEAEKMAADGYSLQQIREYLDESLDWYRRQLIAVRDAAMDGKWCEDILAALRAVEPRGEYMVLGPEQPQDKRSLQDRIADKFS